MSHCLRVISILYSATLQRLRLLKTSSWPSTEGRKCWLRCTLIHPVRRNQWLRASLWTLYPVKKILKLSTGVKPNLSWDLKDHSTFQWWRHKDSVSETSDLRYEFLEFMWILFFNFPFSSFSPLHIFRIPLCFFCKAKRVDASYLLQTLQHPFKTRTFWAPVVPLGAFPASLNNYLPRLHLMCIWLSKLKTA